MAQDAREHQEISAERSHGDGNPKKGKGLLNFTTVRDAIGSAMMLPDSPVGIASIEVIDGDVIILITDTGQRFAVCVAED